MADELNTPPGEGTPPAEGAPPADPPPAGNDPPDDNRDTGFQKRIDQLTRKNYEKDARIANLEGRLEAMEKLEPTPPPKELNPDDFETPAEYHMAVAKQAEQRVEARLRDEARQRETERVQQETLKRYDKAREKYPDFDEVALNQGTPITQDMFDAAQGENLGDVLYELGKNPGEAARISRLPRTAQIKEIGKIEARLTAKPPPTPKPSAAPTPPQTLSGTGHSPPPKSEEDKTRQERFKEWGETRKKRLGG